MRSTRASPPEALQNRFCHLPLRGDVARIRGHHRAAAGHRLHHRVGAALIVRRMD